MMHSNTKSDIYSKLSGLDKVISQLASDADRESDFSVKITQSKILNPWFTEDNVRSALKGLAHMLRPEALEKWVNSYPIKHSEKPQRVGLILAGNIPMVGFHDIFCVSLSGNKPVVKLSSQDKILLPALFEEFNKSLGENFFDVEWLNGMLPQVDAVIATGSNNTARYFEYYFGKKPNIIRKNRNAVAILRGDETKEELEALGSDIFSYFGMGCRNVSKLYVHSDFEINRFFEGIYPFNDIVNHHKYGNNYDYYRAVWMMNQEDLLENGFMILRPCEAIASPIATVFYERYDDEKALYAQLEEKAEEIQCIVSKNDIPFGSSQKPELWDYADGVDTMEFLLCIG